MKMLLRMQRDLVRGLVGGEEGRGVKQERFDFVKMEKGM